MHSPIIASCCDTFRSFPQFMMSPFSCRWVGLIKMLFAICLGSSPHQWSCPMLLSDNSLQFFQNFSTLLQVSCLVRSFRILHMFLCAISISVMSSFTSACCSFLPSLGSLHSSASGSRPTPSISPRSLDHPPSLSLFFIFDDIWLINVFWVIFPFFRHPHYFLQSFGGMHVCIQAIVDPCFSDNFALFCFLLCYFICSFVLFIIRGLSLARVILASFFLWMLSWTSSFHHRVSFPASNFQMFSLSISRPSLRSSVTVSQSCVPSLTLCYISFLPCSVNWSLYSGNFHHFVLGLDGLLSVALLLRPLSVCIPVLYVGLPHFHPG